MIDHQAALIYTMVIVSAADGNMSDRELRIIGDNVRDLPVFADYDRDGFTKTLAECAEQLGHEKGLEEAFTMIRTALPPGTVHSRAEIIGSTSIATAGFRGFVSRASAIEALL